MTVHPLLAGALFIDALALGLVLAAAWTAFAVVLHWAPENADAAQLRLEARAETAGICARLAFGGFLLATGVLAAAIAGSLPGLVPGAMCGTGVIQAMGRYAPQAMLLRLAALIAMGAWWVFDGLNRRHPHGPATEGVFRCWLALVPLAILAFGTTAWAVLALDTHTPVSCCAAVYDAATPDPARRTFSPAGRVGGWIAASACLLGLCLHSGWQRVRRDAFHRTSLAILVPAWAWVSLSAVSGVLAAYHYQVLHHRCLWCLFLPEHHRIGWLVFGAWTSVLMAAAAAWTAAGVAEKYPALAPWAETRYRTAMLGTAAALMVFTLAAGLPALLWRIRYGVWISG